MKIPDALKDYLTFSRKERIASLVLLGFILLIIFLPDIHQLVSSGKTASQDTSWMNKAAALQKKENSHIPGDTINESVNGYTFQHNERPYHVAESELFEFDPNTLSTEGWQQLGVKEKTVHTIQNYLSKGGHFYKPEDVKKIYGMYDDLFERLLPYIKISGTGVKEERKSYTPTATKSGYSTKLKAVDLNTADTTALIALPGIGSKLAFRIINFRDKLGGFYSVEQVKETYGLPDSTFQKIRPFLEITGTTVHKFNINTASKDELKIHPYIKWNLANAIVEYRNQHGNYKTMEDLKRITIITEDVFQKITPYLFL